MPHLLFFLDEFGLSHKAAFDHVELRCHAMLFLSANRIIVIILGGVFSLEVHHSIDFMVMDVNAATLCWHTLFAHQSIAFKTPVVVVFL
jgi:DNA-binding MurR/RpiR family transcriptional regulator